MFSFCSQLSIVIVVISIIVVSSTLVFFDRVYTHVCASTCASIELSDANMSSVQDICCHYNLKYDNSNEKNYIVGCDLIPEIDS